MQGALINNSFIINNAVFKFLKTVCLIVYFDNLYNCTIFGQADHLFTTVQFYIGIVRTIESLKLFPFVAQVKSDGARCSTCGKLLGAFFQFKCQTEPVWEERIALSPLVCLLPTEKSLRLRIERPWIVVMSSSNRNPTTGLLFFCPPRL